MIHIGETDSTNRWLMEHGGDDDMVVWADYQTQGRGCGTNRWESRRGENLLFSVLMHPLTLEARFQFRISMAVSLAIIDALTSQLSLPSSQFAIKWPNDIYWGDKKLCGILIENQLTGQHIKRSIIGVGLNVNQVEFVSDAPNPVSLSQITGQRHDRNALLAAVIEALPADPSVVDADRYRSLLYRREGYHPYRDTNGTFEARLVDVEDDGHLQLCDRQGHERRYAFKEVEFIIKH